MRCLSCLMLNRLPPVIALLVAAGLLPARADQLEDFVRREMHTRHIPGLAFGVVRDGKLVRAEGLGFANLEWHIRATPETVFSLHSVSKQFTAAGVLLLVERGKVGLDDPVGRYFEGTPESWKDITVRHLLTHTSGLVDYLGINDLGLPDDASDEDTMRAMMKRPLEFSPGEKWSYCNTGYLILGLIARKAAGMPVTDFLRREVFGPLGMKSSYQVSRTEVIPHRAMKYHWRDGRWVNAELPFDTEQISDSKMLSTVRDLARWDIALTEGRVLSPESRKAMWTPFVLNDGTATEYGFGWFVDTWQGHRRIWHNGASYNGNRTIISRFPDDRLTVIVLTNGGTADFKTLANGIAGFYVPVLKPAVKTPAPESSTR